MRLEYRDKIIGWTVSTQHPRELTNIPCNRIEKSHTFPELPLLVSKSSLCSGYRPHTHNYLEITYIIQGQGTVYIDRVPHPFIAHQILFTPAGVVQEFRSKMKYKTVCIGISKSLYRRLLNPEWFTLLRNNAIGLNFCSLSVPVEAIDEIENIIETLFREFHFCPHMYQVALELDVQRFFIAIERLFSEKCSFAGQSNEIPTELYQVLIRMENDYQTLKTLDDIRGNVALKKSNFIQLFKKATGFTPMVYLSHIRISRACALLKKTRTSIEDIAFITGFITLSTFYRQFRKIKKCSPRAFREQYKINSTVVS